MNRRASILAVALNLLAGGVVPGMVSLPAKAAEETPQNAPADAKDKCAAMMEHMHGHRNEEKHENHDAGARDHGQKGGAMMGAMEGCSMMQKSDAAPPAAPEGQSHH